MSIPTQTLHPGVEQTQQDLVSLRSVQSDLVSLLTDLLVSTDTRSDSTVITGLADLHDLAESLIAHGGAALKGDYDANDDTVYPLVGNCIGPVCAAIAASEGNAKVTDTLSSGYTVAYNAFEWVDARVSISECFVRERRSTCRDMRAAASAVEFAEAALIDAEERSTSSECQSWGGVSELQEALAIAQRRYERSRWVHAQVQAACTVLKLEG